VAQNSLIRFLCCSGILLLLAPVLGCDIYAQNVVFIAEATPNRVGVKDKVQVQFMISDAPHLQTITPPASTDFLVIAGPYQQQTVNRSMNSDKVVQSVSVTLTYMLQPRSEGTFTIPPATARDASGRVYQSNPLTIQVVPGSISQTRRVSR